MTEARGQKQEVRRQKLEKKIIENGRWKMEGRGKRSEARSQKTEVRKTDNRKWRMEN